MLHSVDQSSQSTQPFYPGWDCEQCTPEKVNDLMVEKYLALVEDGHKRMTGYRENRKFATQGPWYPNANFKALVEIEKEPKKRLRYFKEHGNFNHGLPPKGFYHVAEPDHNKSVSGKRFLGYALKEGTSASAGIQSAKENFYFADCRLITQLAFYDTLLEIAGTENFDAYFHATGKHPLCFDSETTPLDDFQTTVVVIDPRHHKKGDKVYFQNPPSYSLRHIHGEAQGYWCLCTETEKEPKFVTFGQSSIGLITNQMHSILVNDFNEEPLPAGSIMTDELEKKTVDNAINRTATLQGIPQEVVRSLMEEGKNLSITEETIDELYKADPTLAGLNPHAYRVKVDKIRECFIHQKDSN